MLPFPVEELPEMTGAGIENTGGEKSEQMQYPVFQAVVFPDLVKVCICFEHMQVSVHGLRRIHVLVAKPHVLKRAPVPGKGFDIASAFRIGSLRLQCPVQVYGLFQLSDRLENVRGNVSVETMLLSGEKVSSFGKRIVAGANSSTKVLSLPVAEMTGGCKEGNVVIVLEFVPDKGGHDGLETEYANHFFLPKQKDMDYPDCHIFIDVKEADGRYEVSATSGNFARGVYLYADGLDLHFSDNFFDLLPGETRTVTVETDIPAETLRARLRTMSLADTY